MERKRVLRDLAAAAGDSFLALEGDGSVGITHLHYDSRSVAPGGLFFCIPGLSRDGHDFAGAAVAAGAIALVVQHRLDTGVPQVIVEDARVGMARMAAAFFEHPASSMTLLGVTGTNGKTTTAFILESILRAAGETTGLIGTVETRVGGDVRPGVRTTPESLDLQRLFADMRSAGVTAVAMEVTSHGLVLKRVEGVLFQAAGFTNLSQDHLDFHRDMEDYFAAKRSLFTPEHCRAGAANTDDLYGRKLIEAAEVPCIPFGTAADALVRVTAVELGGSQTRLVITTPAGDLDVTTGLVGHFNVSNCLAAAAIAHQAGIQNDDIRAGIEICPSIPGRFEAIAAGQPFTVVIDYAHTPEALDNVLRAARPLTGLKGGRVVAAFGCGGDRDRKKRPLMGAVAARLADIVVVTSDNPRSEDPNAIIGEILEGVYTERAQGADLVLPDRREAIEWALKGASPGDVVVIAGKGHETGQELGDRTIPFDDRVVAREVLHGLGYGGRG